MGLVVSIDLICKSFNITQGSVEIGLDGEEAMKAIFAEQEPKVEAPCYDIIKDIRRKIKALPVTVTGRHIKGHQDKHKEYHELDRWSQLNVKMDSRAKALLRRRIQEGFQPVPQEFGNETLPVYFQGRKLSRFHKPVAESLLEVVDELVFLISYCVNYELISAPSKCIIKGIPPTVFWFIPIVLVQDSILLPMEAHRNS